MAIDKSIFPEGCYLAFMDDGRLSPTGELFLNEQILRDQRGHGAEHPCFGCRLDDCDDRAIQYNSQEQRYIAPPKNPKPLR